MRVRSESLCKFISSISLKMFESKFRHEPDLAELHSLLVTFHFYFLRISLLEKRTRAA